jgi:manganese/zinc/iron transport system substrate-binding protein
MVKYVRTLFFVVFFFCITLWFAKNYFTTNKQYTTKKKIVCTTGMIASVVQEIVQDTVDVVCLMGPGVDPHVYKARTSDVMHIQQAQLILYSGLHLEGKMAELLQELHKTKLVFAVTDVIARSLLIEVDNQVYDPHVWHDVSLWKMIVLPIAQKLTQVDPEHAQLFADNAQKYIKKLDKLDKTMKQKCAIIPAEKRILVSAHDAFGYFGKAYGFKVVALQGVSTDAQPGLADIVQLAQFIFEHHIPVVFLESCIPPKSIEAVVGMVGRLGGRVAVGQELLADALGMRKDNADSYVGMIEYNMDVIISSFMR